MKFSCEKLGKDSGHGTKNLSTFYCVVRGMAWFLDTIFMKKHDFLIVFESKNIQSCLKLQKTT